MKKLSDKMFEDLCDIIGPNNLNKLVDNFFDFFDRLSIRIGLQISGNIITPKTKIAKFICNMGVNNGDFLKIDDNTFIVK